MKKTFLLMLLFLGSFFSTNGATFTVINTNDSGAGSLRQAILDANTAGGNSTINFNIPGAAPQIIVPTTFNSTTAPRAQVYQPLVNNNITIDATTQPGYSFGNPSIVINCSTIAATGNSGSCFFIQGANNCTIKGLGICNYVGSLSGNAISIENTATQGASNNQITKCTLGTISSVPPFGNTRGIVISGRFTPTGTNAITNNIVGGPGALDGNIISGNSVAGVQLQFGPNSTVIKNNLIGCDATGTSVLGNAQGVNLIGNQPGTGQSGPCNNNNIQNNVISGNSSSGIVLQGSVNNNTIKANKIGTDITGSVLLSSTSAVGIGLAGDASDTCYNNIMQNNIIGGNNYGISLATNSSFNQILSNYIGTNSLGANLGNNFSGIITQGSATLPCTNNLISLNTISNNGNGVGATDFYGVFIDGDPTTPDILNQISQNSIFNNNNNGIKLSNNGNDNQAPPVLINSYISATANTVVVKATAPTTPASSIFRLEFFVSDVNRNPITEGQRYIGAVSSVPSGATITHTFIVPLPALTGTWISATATNLNSTGATPGDTSEYSQQMAICPLVGSSIISLLQTLFNKYGI